MIRTIIPHSLVKAFLASHNETKSNRCSSMASASEWACEVCPCLNTMEQRAIVAQVWPLLPSEHAKSVLASTQWNKEQSLLKYGLCFRVSMQSLSLPQHNGTKSNRCSSMASASEWACKSRHSSSGAVNDAPGMIRTIILIVLWRPSLPHTMKQRAIVAQVWPPLPSEHASQALILRCCQWCLRNDSYYYSSVLWRPSLPHTINRCVWPLLPSEHAKSVLASTQWNKEQSLLKYGLCFRVSMRSLSLPQHNGTKSNRCSSMASASEWACKPGTCPQVLSMMPPEWFVLLFLIVFWRPSLPHTHNETKSNRCSSMAFASEWVCKPGTHPQVLSMMPPEWFVLLFLIVLWRPSLPHTMKQRAIVAQVWPPLPSECASQALILRCCQWCPRNDLYYYSS